MTGNRLDRARGALIGLAMGDALGMPTQYLPRELVRDRYGLLDTFQPGPEDNELCAGLPAGRVTDDTDQAVILGRLLVSGAGQVDPQQYAQELLAWEDRMRAAGSLDLLGPSTLKALAAVAAGASTEQSGRWGDTNGAAMRIAPVGIATPVTSFADMAAAVHAVSHVTHNTQIATAGATAVAAAISVAIEGATLTEALTAGLEGALAGAEFGFYVAGANVATRISWALDLVRDLDVGEALDRIYDLVGSGVATQEAVPAAFAFASLLGEDPWLTCRAAASLGGDCDTIAAMAGAIVGALHGASAFPADRVAELNAVNPTLRLEDLAADLLDLRDASL
ncbi:MAG: ADP-ribosylglycohydrolase family protein [Propioniciclava sp.]